MSEQQQAVVEESEVPAKQGAETTDARDDGDLETLLKEYEGSEKDAPKTPPPDQGGDDLRFLAEQTRGELSRLQQARFKSDMQSTIKSVRGSLDPEYFDDDLVEAWVNKAAMKDSRLGLAWRDREEKPREFKKVVEHLGKEFAKRYGKLPDREATDNREAVTAAVRGASGKAPEEKAPDLSRLSNDEFRKEAQRLWGFTPNV